MSGNAGETKNRNGWWFVCLLLQLFVVLLFSAEVAGAAVLTLHPSGSASGDGVDYIGGTAADALDSNDEWDSYGQSLNSTNDYYLEMDDAAASGVINSVVVRAVVAEAGYPSGTSMFRMGIKTNGAEYFSSSISQSDPAFVLHSGDVYTTNPGTGSAWTWSEVNNLVAIVDHENDNQMRVTELYVEVDYTPAATTIILSGTLYSDEGITPVSGQTVRLVVEGVSTGTAITDTSGGYSISAVISPANIWYIPLLVYVDDGTVDATTVTTMDSTLNSATISGLDLYADHLVIRQDAGSAPLDTGDMHNAKNAYSDIDVLYVISWPDTTVTGAGTELYIPGGYSYTPLGNVATPHMKILGTLTAGSNTFTVSGNWDHTSGTFNSDTSTVNFTGTGTIRIDVSNWWTKPFYNVNAAAAGQTTTVVRGMTVENLLVLGTGVVAGGEVLLDRDGGTPLVTTGATLSNYAVKYAPRTNPVNVAATDYPRLWLSSSGPSITFTLLGDIICNKLWLMGNYGDESVLDTASHSITCNLLEVGFASMPDRYGKLLLNNSSVDLGGLIIHPSDSGGMNQVDAGSATINVSGDWTNSDTFTAGTSTVNFNGAGQILNGSTTFHNLTRTVTGADTLTFAAGSTQTVTGSATLQGSSGQLLSLRSGIPGTRWHFNLAAGATSSISHVDVQDSDASGSDAALLEINPAFSTDSGNNVSWFGNANITVVKSSAVISDPYNGVTNPKRIPGAIVEYTIRVTNTAGAQATNVTITDDLSAESARLSFVPDGYAVADKGILVTAPNINGGSVQSLTNAVDADQGEYASSTVTVKGIVLNAGEQAVVTFRVTIR